MGGGEEEEKEYGQTGEGVRAEICGKRKLSIGGVHVTQRRVEVPDRDEALSSQIVCFSKSKLE